MNQRARPVDPAVVERVDVHALVHVTQMSLRDASSHMSVASTAKDAYRHRVD